MLRITFVVFVLGLVAMVSSSKEALTQAVIKETGNANLAEGDRTLYTAAFGIAEGCGGATPGEDGVAPGAVFSQPGNDADDAINFAKDLAGKIVKTASSVSCDAVACPDGNVYGGCAYE